MASLPTQAANPYDWTSERPKHAVRRETLLRTTTEALTEKEGVVVLLGARGMGKSVFLSHIEELLRARPDMEVVVFSIPPLPAGPERVVDDLLGALVDALLAAADRRGGDDRRKALAPALQAIAKRRVLLELFQVFLNEFEGQVNRLVLIYDELDAYAKPATVGRAFFDALEDSRKKLNGRLAILAAGGLGLLSLKTVLGSSIFTRAARRVLEPFDGSGLSALAQPFLKERGAELTEETLETLRVLSGGNLALATYGLQSIWREAEPSPKDLVRAYDEFVDVHNDFGAAIRSAIFDFNESSIPFHVWKALKKNAGVLTRTELDRLRSATGVEARLETKDILDMLRASGFVAMDDSAWKADPIVAAVIPSILTFDTRAATNAGSLPEQLHADIVEAMGEIHRMAPAFYRPGTRASKNGPKEDKQLVPESVFAAALALNLRGQGWRVELEPMSATGYTDVKTSHARFVGQHGIVEVKIWPRHVEGIHGQVCGYFTVEVTACGFRAIVNARIGPS